MNTTPLRIEILILGFQASVSLFFLSGLTFDQITVWFLQWKDVSLVLAVIVFGLCYSLGTFVDAVSGAIELTYRYKIKGKPKNSYKSKFWLDYADASSQISSRYFDLRMMRGTIFNLLILNLALIYSKQEYWVIICVVIVFGFLLYSWNQRREILAERLKNISDSLELGDVNISRNK